MTTQNPQLDDNLCALRLPHIRSVYADKAQECREKAVSFESYLGQLCQEEVEGRAARSIQEKIRKAQFPSIKTLADFRFEALPSLSRDKIVNLAEGHYLKACENVLALGPSGTGKTHMALALGVAACEKGYSVLFRTAATLTHELREAHDERRLLSLQKKLSEVGLLIVDELGYVPFSKDGAELLFDVLSKRYERGSLLITSNLPFEEWPSVLGCHRLTGALLDRLTHHVHILEMKGASYRLQHSQTQ